MSLREMRVHLLQGVLGSGTGCCSWTCPPFQSEGDVRAPQWRRIMRRRLIDWSWGFGSRWMLHSVSHQSYPTNHSIRECSHSLLWLSSSKNQSTSLLLGEGMVLSCPEEIQVLSIPAGRSSIALLLFLPMLSTGVLLLPSCGIGLLSGVAGPANSKRKIIIFWALGNS